MGLNGYAPIDEISDWFNNATGHKSKHYTAAQQDDIAAEKVRTDYIAAHKPGAQDDGPAMVESRMKYGPAATGMSQKPMGNGLGLAQRKWEESGPELTTEERAAVAKSAMQRTAMMAQQTQMVNEAANNTRFGGRFTDAGLMNVDKDARNNALDRIKARSMISPMGLGGSGYRMPGSY